MLARHNFSVETPGLMFGAYKRKMKYDEGMNITDNLLVIQLVFILVLNAV